MPDPTYEAGVRDERARVVRWLRRSADKDMELARGFKELDLANERRHHTEKARHWLSASWRIERGEHEEARDGGE